MIQITRRRIRKIMAALFCLSLLNGCGKEAASDSTEDVMNDVESGMEENAEQEESENAEEADAVLMTVPQLPDTGEDLHDFVPEDWWFQEYVQLDYNEDGIFDYVGVLTDEDSSLLLLAIASDGENGYHLDFQDDNLIRTGAKGVNHYNGRKLLTAEGTSFTTHATYSYGGSEWNLSEEYTCTYREGIWWLTASETTYGYKEYATSYCLNDWESGVRTGKRRSSEPDDMEGKRNTAEYDVVYELALDEPLTLEQAVMRVRGAVKNADLEVRAITFGEEVALTENMVKLPKDKVYLEYYDEDCVLYTFGSDFCYLAMYSRQDGELSVLTKEKAAIDGPAFYKGKIYYSAEITEGTETVGVRLKRIETDGTGKETVFEYLYPEAGMGDGLPYPALQYELSGDEIVAEVAVRGAPHPFYRMNIDGSEQREIGQMPKALEIPEEKNGIMEIYAEGGRITIPEGFMTAQVSPQEILKGNPVIYDRFRVDGWVFEWLISDYYDEDNWFAEDGVLAVSREGSEEDAQVIHVTAEGGYATWVSAEDKFEYVDVNFDGTPDLLICTGHHGNQGLLTYYCFLQTKNGFAEAPTFTDISNPAVDAENQLIRSQWRNSAASHSWAEYRCRNNTYVRYRVLCEDVDLSGVYNGGEEVWVWTVNGEEVARSDELSEEEIEAFLYGENSEWKLADDRWRTLYNDGLTTDYSIYSSP